MTILLLLSLSGQSVLLEEVDVTELERYRSSISMSVVLHLNFYVMGKAQLGELSCTGTGLVAWAV